MKEVNKENGRLVGRTGKKKKSAFNCRKGKHLFLLLVNGKESKEYSFSWCSVCGCLERVDYSGEEKEIVIYTPDLYV